MSLNNNISFKNYFLLSIILIISIVIIIYFYMWYGEFKSVKLNETIIDDYLSVINYNELESYLVENKNVVLYVSILNNEEIRKFENKFKDIINIYDLNNKLLYLDLSSQYENKDVFNIIKEKYNLLDMPCIVIFNNGKVSDVYSIEDRDYDLDLLISYLKIRGVIYD